MTEYNKDLKDNEATRLQLVSLVRNDGLRIAEAARALGLAERTCQNFFKQDTEWSKAFWNGYKEPVETLKTSGNSTVLRDSPLIGACLNTPLTSLAESFKNHLKLNAYVGVTKPTQLTKKILVIADTQCKPTESLEYMSWIGKYIADKKPDVVVHIGDHYDFPSLSSYDKGRKSFEGRRLIKDIEAGNLGMHLLLKEFTGGDYKPRMVFCKGNHEDRLDRLADSVPELDGYVGTEFLPLEGMGWEVQPFLKPVEIDGIYFVHYLANPMTGKPYGGTALNQLKTVGRSFVVGHKQCLDIATRPTIDGKHQIGIVNGAAYPFDEGYKGYQGNNHFRGITMLHEVEDGFALPMWVSLNYLKKRYEA